MSRVFLLPRIKKFHVDSQIAHMQGAEFSPRYSHLRDDSALYYATSGGSFDDTRVEGLADRIREEARRQKFPARAGRPALAEFDTQVTILLAQEVWLNSGEALRDDTWAYITTMLLPDVVAWRFPGCNPERFHGGIRNTFQRLWMRGGVLDRGLEADNRWELVERLGEDALVQIFERSGLSNNPRLAHQFAEGYLSWLDNVGKTRIEDIMRDAMKVLLLRNKVIDLSSQDDSVLHQEVWQAFRTAWEGHRKSGESVQDIDKKRKGFLGGLMFWRR
ncbi:DUF6339 family protein [Halomonas elongata]|uniref:DUF6339 family protein n=1 Tax=Halomonas elongata (strain ATCC 33173 / DSM 2581 / NBRC 15536 / NCIMB 2198 / 1H9) TaxID=768066 RepID=A0A1R4A4J4_HALED|nr:DUF6339 family protein [Halomonas elongata]WBF18050.1 DUF6339 family protein [Halomonas elongata]WPU46900.1 DUF6339 family protein [Halomonas elongata DSM 2581]SJK83897.1 uncharacterized protein HELO_4398A [Halomonas elongata DSM 2581]